MSGSHPSGQELRLARPHESQLLIDLREDLPGLDLDVPSGLGQDPA